MVALTILAVPKDGEFTAVLVTATVQDPVNVRDGESVLSPEVLLV